MATFATEPVVEGRLRLLEQEQESLKEKLLEMNRSREAMESDIKDIVDFLQSPQPSGAIPGLKGNLVDEEGFPRADMDIHMIRIQRNRLAHLQTDHSGKMKEIEAMLKELQKVFQSLSEITLPNAPEPSESSVASLSLSPSTKDEEKEAQDEQPEVLAHPYAKVHEVTPNSPSNRAGLKPGDKIVKFGTVVKGVGGLPDLHRTAAYARENENKTVEIIVMRGSTVKRIALVPSSDWGGPGLLGCHLVPES